MGRKRFAIDFWKTLPADGDPDWTSYSDYRDEIIGEAKKLKQHFAAAILYERDISATPDWDTVESHYWREPKRIW
jgi:hypothetical protein